MWNKKPTRCHLVLYLFLLYKLLNMFRATLCPSSGADDLVVFFSACGVVKKAWKALHFTMRILKKGNSNTKSLAYMSLVHPILEYGAACWDPYREGQISALDRVQKKAAKFAHYTNSLNWETLASRRKLSRLCALFKA